MGRMLKCLPRLSIAQLRPTLRSTTAGTCRRDLHKFPSPQSETHVLLVAFATHACTTAADALVTYRKYVQQRLKNSHRPHGKMADMPKSTHLVLSGICTCQPRLQTSHRPDGKLKFCSLFAGRWCRCRGRHSVNRELPDLHQHSYLCAR